MVMSPASTISGRLADPADVLHPVGGGKAEVAVQAVTDVVAVEDVGVPVQIVQAALQQVGDGGLARPGQARHPDHHRPLMLDGRAMGLVDGERLPDDVVGAAQREVEQAGADGGVALPVDEDEAAEVGIVGERLEGDAAAQADVGDADLVQAQALGRQGLQGVDVDAVLELGDVHGTARSRSSGSTDGPDTWARRSSTAGARPADRRSAADAGPRR
jgi:hypothetical protein